MIVIDEHAEVKLVKALEELRATHDASRAIYLKFSAYPHIKADVARIVDIANRALQNSNQQIYVCEDGDIFILASMMPTKEARMLMDDIAFTHKIFAVDDFASLYEMSIHANALLIIVEQKLERRRKLREQALKKQEELLAGRKRQTILQTPVPSHKMHDFAARRAGRSTPELMMIEDDAFSRRLVENVLSKDYHLTSLANAERALFTYTNLAPDVLFLDINLPDVTGHELLEKIKAIDPEAYVVMLSGNSDKDNILQAMGAGAKGFIAKPFTREKLFEYIHRCPTIKS